uniref:non-specific serine/threonine protein kinase n=1 Tax=Brassica campestris TaxID=3711 RepID=M4CJ10_BRACM
MDEGQLELAEAYNEELDKPEICNGDGAVWVRNEKEKEDDALELRRKVYRPQKRLVAPTTFIIHPLQIIQAEQLFQNPDDELHSLCSQPFPCGNQSGLLYPFWISGREDCGHPDFKVDCNRGFAELSISSVKYRILEANYDSRIIRLARSDFIGNLCPTNPLNMPFNQNVLPLAPTTQLLRIYYDCHQDFSQIRNVFNSFRVFCDKNVTIPASGPALNTLELNSSTDNLKKALEEGFELGLHQDCSTCLTSGGACGFNRSSIAFTCYNSNRTRNNGIGIASVLVLLILVAGCALCLIRRRKIQASQYTSKDLSITSNSNKEASSHLTPKTISSHPTPKAISSHSNHALIPPISNITNASTYFGVQVFSYEELEEATENFSRELGDGGFGTVYYGVLKDGRAVAVKRLYEKSLQRVEQFKNEIDILKTMKHPNLVILYGCTSRHSSELLLVYEYISNGTLADHLHGDRAETRPLCWPIRLKIAIETASALSFLHKSGIIHRDVKTTNILLDENSTVKVADFGLSRLFSTDQTHVSTMPQGTPGYVDPEYYQCYRLNEKSDVYSFGVVLTELISSKEAVDITRHRHDVNLANMAVSKIQNNAVHELVDPSLGFEKDPEVKRMMLSVAELAFRCLQQEREARPSMDEIMETLKGIKGEKCRKLPDVVDIVVSRGDDVGLLRHSDPPPVSPDADMCNSSSDTAARSF